MRRILVAFLVISVVTVANAQNSFQEKFQRTLSLKQYPNPNLVYPGDTVFVPVIIQEKDFSGHDCIYKAVQRADINVLPIAIVPDTTANKTLPKEPAVSKPEKAKTNDWLFFFLAMAIAASVAALVVALMRRRPDENVEIHYTEIREVPQPEPTPIPVNVDVQVNVNGQEVTVQSSGGGNISVRVNLAPAAPAPQAEA